MRPEGVQGFPTMTGMWQWDRQDYVSLVGRGHVGQRVPKPLVLSSKSAGIPKDNGDVAM